MRNKIDLFRIPWFNLCFSDFFFCIYKSFFCKYFSLSRCANHRSSSFKASLQQILDLSLDELLLQRRLIGWQTCGTSLWFNFHTSLRITDLLWTPLCIIPNLSSENLWPIFDHIGCRMFGSDHPSPMQLPSLYSSYSSLVEKLLCNRL